MKYFRSILLLMLAFLPVALFGQFFLSEKDAIFQSAFGQVYRIQAGQAAALCHYKADPKSDQPNPLWESLADELLQQIPLDTFHGAEPTRQLPPGVYVAVRAIGEDLKMEVLNIHSFSVHIRPNPHALELVLYDSSAQLIKNAKVFYDGQALDFRKKSQSYRLEKCRKGGVLEVYWEKELLIQEIQESYSSWSNFRKRRLYYQLSHGKARILYRPYRWMMIGKQMLLHPFSRRFYYQFSNQRRSKLVRKAQKQAFYGYVIFSQPRYLPGDTLKVNAWIANEKGRPRKKPVQFQVSQGGKHYFRQDLKATSPGNFEFSCVLMDSLALDQNYQAEFFQEELPRRFSKHFDYEDLRWQLLGQFRYEDYQLNVVTYEFNVARGNYSLSDTVKLNLEALDVNKQPVPAIDVHIVVRAQQINGIYRPSIYVPDTLWQTKQSLSGERYTSISIPPDVFPDASMQIEALATFVNSGGEMQSKSCSWYVNRPAKAPKLELLTHNGQEMKVFWRDPDSRTPDSAQLKIRYASGINEIRRIKLPYAQELPRSVSHVLVRSGNAERENNIWNAPFNLILERLDDTVQCRIENPKRDEIRYELTEDNKIIEEGILRDSLWLWRKLEKNEHKYAVLCYLMMSGQDYKWSEELPFYANQLDIKIKQPEKVRPGETTQIELSVKDAYQKVVRNANLSAIGINGQFGNSLPFEAPEILQKTLVPPFVYGQFSLSDSPGSKWRGSATIWRQQQKKVWYERLGLDSFLFYRLRFNPDDSTCFVLRREYPARDSSDYRRPQFSPFVMVQGKAEPIQLIYCNKRLVYVAASSDVQPYSFYGDKGKNEIVLRCNHAEYKIEGLELDYGEKVELAIAPNAYKRSWKVNSSNKKNPLTVTESAQVDSLSLFEQNLLRQSMLLWHSPKEEPELYYFWQDNHSIHFLRSSQQKTVVIGPFNPEGRDISFLKRFDFFTKFKFEPGFVYEIQPNRERLYANNWPSGMGKLFAFHPVQPAGMLAINAKQIDFGKIQKEQEFKLSRFAVPAADVPGKASLRWFLSMPKDSQLLAIGLKSADTLIGPFKGDLTQITGLPRGKFNLLLFSAGKLVIQVPVELRKDSALIIHLDNSTFDNAPKGLRLGDLFHLDTIESIKKSALSSLFSQWPVGMGGVGMLRGSVRGDHEALIGASIRFFQSGTFIQGAITDIDGRFAVRLNSGVYDVEVSYTGFRVNRISGLILTAGMTEELNIDLEGSSELLEVVVTGVSAGLIKKDGVSSVLTSDIIPFPLETGNSKMVEQVALDAIVEEPEDADKTALPLPEIGKGEIKIRQKFKDNAWWQPHLTTDKQGKAAFQVTFPDNITAWNSYVVAMDRKRRAGLGFASTLSYLPLSAQLMLPRFAVAGDRFDAAGLLSNMDSDSARVETAFYQNGQMLLQSSHKIGSGLAEYASVQVPAQGDSLHIRYEIKGEQMSDAEARSLAILPIGTEEVSGAFWFIEQDTTLVFTPEANRGTLTFYAESNAVDVLLEDVKYLINYPFGCNEQTSSRLTALLLAREITKYRPDLGLISTDAEIQKCVNQLRKTQNNNGSWGWWSGDEPDSWMSVYVLRALNRAKNAGFGTIALDQGLVWLRANLDALKAADLSDALILLRECGVNMDCTPYLNNLEKIPAPTLNERLVRFRLSQYCGKTLVRDSLSNLLQSTQFGSLYCGENNYSWYNRRAMNTLLAYDIAETAEWTDICQKIRKYWYFTRDVRTRNTIETAQILLRLLPYALKLPQSEAANKTTLWVNGEPVKRMSGRMTVPGDKSVKIQTKGSLPIFVTAYQRYFNPTPSAQDSHYVLRSAFYQRGVKVDGKSLVRGEAAQLKVSLQVKADAEYVMVEIPIPAGCSYGLKVQAKYGSQEVHREYFRDKTVVFYRHLPKGNYQVNINLEPRFSGTFTLNPARAEQMYFPVFDGHDVVKGVGIR